VRETRWHPSQKLDLTRDGCEWTAIIGDTLEIEPWIRGWGGDCEVLEPLALRERIIAHLHSMLKNYGLTLPKAHNPEEFDDDLFRAKE
jgi:predicted DNA-binding transcriptional regulator YafY